MGDEHQRNTGQRHPQRADDEKRGCGHGQPAEERQQSPLPPPVNHVAAGNRAPDARRPEVMLVEQIHASIIWRNPPPLASFSGYNRNQFCSGGHPCLPYPAASCRPVHKTEPVLQPRFHIEPPGWKPDDTAARMAAVTGEVSECAPSNESVGIGPALW